MIIIGYDINKQITMADRVSKVFAGVQGAVFQKAPPGRRRQ